MSNPEKNLPNQPFNNNSNIDASPDKAGRRLIRAKRLREKLGDVSAMWIFRHKDELPTPTLIAGRRFWHEEEIDAFIDGRLAERKREETDLTKTVKRYERSASLAQEEICKTVDNWEPIGHAASRVVANLDIDRTKSGRD